jgi:aminopeptidase N
MPIGLILITIVVWIAVLTYSFRLIPRTRRAWSPWGAAVAVLAAVLLTAGSYQVVQRRAEPDPAQQYYHAGIDEKQRGNLSAAEENFERALALQPGHPDAARELEEVRGRGQAAAREQRPDLQVDPDASPSRGHPGRRPEPAPHKPSPFEIAHYALDLTLDPPRHSLEAHAVIRIRSRGPRLRELEFSLNPECRPSAVEVNGAPAIFTHTNDLLTVKVRRPVAARGEAEVSIRYSRTGGERLESSGDLISERGTFLRSETRWYPGTGELDFRSPVRLTARVPAGYTLISVGRLKSSRTEGDWAHFHWETDRAASMISLAARKYTATGPRFSGEGGQGVPVTVYTYPEHQERAEEFSTEAAGIIRYFERIIGPYPYEKLGVVEIPDFPGGYGTTSFVMLIDQSIIEPKLDREFLAHEIAHQWWGNSVFPQGLGAAWLTEAFSNYCAWLYTSSRAGNPRVLQKRVALGSRAYFAAASRMGDQPIRETDPYQPIGAMEKIIYEKGAVVLHMLRAEVGDDAFFEGLRRFAADHRYGRAKIEDYQKLMEGAAGRPLDWFFDQWLGRTGGLSLAYGFDTAPDEKGGSEILLHVSQPAPAFRARVDVLFEVGDGTQRESIEIGEEYHLFRFPVRGKSGARVNSVLFDPDERLLMVPPRWVVLD